MTDSIVTTLAAVLRGKPYERRLVCPRCAGPIALRGGQYVCKLNGTPFRALTDLALEEPMTTAAFARHLEAK